MTLSVFEAGFLRRDMSRYSVVHLFRIGAIMSPAVTVGAYAGHVPGVVGPSVANSPYVMGLKERLASASRERRGLVATFADTICACEHVAADYGAALVHGASGAAVQWGGHRSEQSSLPHFLHVWCENGVIDWIYSANGIANSLDRHQSKDDSRAHVSVDVCLKLAFPPCAEMLPQETNRAAADVLFEDEKVFPIRSMIADGEVAPHHLHVADLAFAGVSQGAIRLPPVSVTDLGGAMAGEDENGRNASWRGDTALLLSPVAIVNVCAAVVGLIRNEGPGHLRSMAWWLAGPQARSREVQAT